MFDARDQDRPWQLYIQDMIDFGEKVLSYTEGHDQESFIADGLIYDATMRNIELIGEAATHVPEDVREAHQEIPWRSIIGTRNQVAHGYLGMDDDVTWDIIQVDVPNLLPNLRRLLDPSGRGQP